VLVLFVGLVLGRWDFPLLLAAAPLKHAQDGAHAVMSVAHFPLLLAAAPLKHYECQPLPPNNHGFSAAFSGGPIEAG